MEEQEERGIQSQRAGLPQVMMMISIVLFQKQTELGWWYERWALAGINGSACTQSPSSALVDARACFLLFPKEREK